MYRLFVAIELPEEVKERLKSLCTGVAGARWVTESQMHLTLHFIGAADEDLFRRIRHALSQIESPGFELHMTGTGCFPSPRKARILWAGIRRNDFLALLKKNIDEALAGEEMEPEGRDFSPHVTLARIKNIHPADVERFLDQTRDFAFPPFPITTFHLYSSVLGKAGATYTKEQSYLLQAP